jgi:hypothetical protein
VIEDPRGDHPAESARLAQVFLWLQRHRFSGNLYVEHGDESLVFGVVGGHPVVVEDAASSESLADYFLARGELSQDQFSQIVALMTEEIVLNEDATFSEHALRLGFLSRVQINDAVSQRVRAKVIQAVGWDTCRYDVEEGSGPSAEAGLSPVRVGPLVYMGVRTFYFDDEIAKLLGDVVGGYLRLKQPVRAIAEMFELEREEVSFVGSIHQEKPLRRAVEGSGLDPLHAWQLIALLRLGELADFAVTPIPKDPPAEQSGLRVTPEAAAPEVVVAPPSAQPLA